MLERRRIDLCCFQERRWKSNGVCQINSDNEKYKLFWNGQKTAKNVVGIFVKKPLAQEVLDIKRINSRLMWIKLRLEKQTMIIFPAYAPQTGKSEEMKNDFSAAFSDTISTIPKSETILIGGDLNGHVGEKTDCFDNVHGGFGYGERNEDGNRILEFAESHGFCLLNTYFRKRLEHLITYKSGPSATQIDFFAVKQHHRGLFKNVTVNPGESCVAQHRLLMADQVVELSQHKSK
ncbi:hypothetical protein HELRODRAFT_68656 [Helobdella robusta]|uniref:Endonuclease/exonuclease/phosphatase domain-containing protein n=1 Tax=Helobdella robusta TaxID=6412 RepID=T1FZH7_HELRO|nr:hypothetical protein HELRODRAFT_68656 [Helobdella robusta]ESN94252.1 hypothetical protein HELRODRAFT_68656 [Helobdella robusta]